MSYLHCHTKGCGWSQDDFWNWKFTFKFWKPRAFGYNPISLIIDDIRIWIKPSYVKTDNGKIFSWMLMCKEIRRHSKRVFTQKWWTYKSFKKDVKAVCPKCKKRCFDID